MNNTSTISRREFLTTSAGLACAAGLAASEAALGAAEKAKPWRVAIRDGHLRLTGEPDCWAALKALDVAAVEVLVDEALVCPGLYDPARRYSLATAESLKQLKDGLTAHGVTITALCMSNRLDERLDEEIVWARKVVGAAQALGATAIRIDVVPRKIGADQFLPFAIKACQQLCQTVQGTPVQWAIENHGSLTNDPAFLRGLFDGVGSPQLGLTLDTMNFYWYGHPLDDVYGICETYAPRTFHTHCKNLRYPAEKRNVRRPIGWEYARYAAPLYDGDLDYRRITEILRKANYQGDLCLENECLDHFPKDQHVEVLRKELALLKTLAGT